MPSFRPRARVTGYFSLELVYDPKAPRSFASGGAFEYLGMTLPSTLATVAYKTDAAVRKMHAEAGNG